MHLKILPTSTHPIPNPTPHIQVFIPTLRFSVPKSVSFLGMPKQVTTNLLAYHKQNLFCHRLRPKSRFQQGCALSEGFRGQSVCSFQLLVTPGIPWLVAAWLPPLSLSSCVFTSSPLCVAGSRDHLHDPDWLHLEILNLKISAKTLFPAKEPPIQRFQALGYETTWGWKCKC